ncbi:MAG TPA: LexA family transcriptional regulator [Stellaceae bacterium]|nr:LexA family transcriptional regulator [Stellaceae bacterium]
MNEISDVSHRLKRLRQRAQLSIRDVAASLGMEHGSSYQHYEDRYKKALLPLELVVKLAPIFAKGGVDTAELFALAGVEGEGVRIVSRPRSGIREVSRGEPLKSPFLQYERMLRIAELDVRASAGGGSELVGEERAIVAHWQVPSGIVRHFSGAADADLRIISVLGDSMEPTLIPGQRILVDAGDKTPSPPGVFVVWDGLGLVVKRLEVLPQSDPPRVRISSDNAKYAPYERTLDEAHIQGRVIGQWRWL